MSAELEWHGEHVKARIRQGELRGLHYAAEHLRKESQKQVPFDEGTLEASAAAQINAAERAAYVSYNTPYAVRQHEELAWNHPKKGKAKYLEDPMHSEASTMRRLIETQIRRSIT